MERFLSKSNVAFMLTEHDPYADVQPDEPPLRPTGVSVVRAKFAVTTASAARQARRASRRPFSPTASVSSTAKRAYPCRCYTRFRCT